MGEMACSVCHRPTVAKTLTFTDGAGELQWSLPVQVCTNASCLLRQGATAVPVKALRS
jgi:hypothetical protein